MVSANRKTLTIWVPSYNEEAALETTINELLPVAREKLDAFEIILVNDGSTDGTGEVADRIAAAHPEISCIHHPQNQGLAQSYRDSLERARYDNIMVVPGDNAFEIKGIAHLLDHIGKADVIIGCRINQSERSIVRSVQSNLMRFILNIVFRLDLIDFHGMPILPVRFQRRIQVRAIGTGYHIESMIPMLIRGLSYVQVPLRLNPEGPGPYPALRTPTYLDLVKTTLRLFFSTRKPFDKAD